MPKIIEQHFRVKSQENLTSFYGDLLGMQPIPAITDSLAFRFDTQQASIQFKVDDVTPYVPLPNDFYWKIGITLRDLDVAVAYLRGEGITVPDPYQFRDIGYMTKLTDPNGFTIELLQQGFVGNTKPILAGHPIGVQATFAHITLRVTDILSARHYFEDALAMRLMSIQPVTEYGFCLYFYTWSEETLPNPDLEAVENRPWLWSRPYTFVELQHLTAPHATIHKTPLSQAGFDGFTYGQPETEPTLVSITDLHTLT